MQKPDKVPEAVRMAVQKWAEFHKKTTVTGGTTTTTKVVPALSWDSLMGCYYFTANGLYHGVELDGYIHT